MKYYIIAGEASGDMHASKLMEQIVLEDKADFRFWGGDLMEKAAGNKPVKHYRDLAFMGFAEVLMNLRTILGNLKFCKNDILKYQPDVVILVDYPGFNLRIAEFVHNQGIKVVYYISPQIWAWKESRIHKIKKFVDLMLVILPFEKAFYAKHNFEAVFVGHPLLEQIKREEVESRPPQKIIALVPGSRVQEVEKMLPVMLEAVKQFPDYKIIITISAHLPKKLYQNIIGNRKVELAYNSMRETLRKSDAALVTSGTATLETALIGIPQVVCYKANKISYQIAKRLVKIDYISLVNLIMNQEVVKELIQKEMNAKQVATELKAILPDGAKRAALLDNYRRLPSELGGKGASLRAAQSITNYLKNS